MNTKSRCNTLPKRYSRIGHKSNAKHAKLVPQSRAIGLHHGTPTSTGSFACMASRGVNKAGPAKWSDCYKPCGRVNIGKGRKGWDRRILMKTVPEVHIRRPWPPAYRLRPLARTSRTHTIRPQSVSHWTLCDRVQVSTVRAGRQWAFACTLTKIQSR